MITRRTCLSALASAAIVATTPATAAEVVVEVLGMQHWPVQNALKPVRELIASYGPALRVSDMDIESAEGVARLRSVGMKGHIPIVILINGAMQFKRADGSVVTFLNFPVAANNPMGMNGAWSIDDFALALKMATGR